jgi:hypothetical protein
MEELLYTIVKDLVKTVIEKLRILRRLDIHQKEFLINVLLDVVRVNAATRHYIQENGGIFRGSQVIKNQFLHLHEKMSNANLLVNDLFPEHLLGWMRDKSIFWDQPEVYSQHPTLLATIPTLDEIDEACKEIILKLR